MSKAFKFIGGNGSMGLRTNEIYLLDLVSSAGFDGSLFARMLNLSGQTMWQCPYENYRVFLDNWEDFNP
jgi:hypothetical protein